MRPRVTCRSHQGTSMHVSVSKVPYQMTHRPRHSSSDKRVRRLSRRRVTPDNRTVGPVARGAAFERGAHRWLGEKRRPAGGGETGDGGSRGASEFRCVGGGGFGGCLR